MRDEELVVAQALVDYLGGFERAQFADGSDPPDIELTVDGRRVSVEVTRLSQRTRDAKGKSQERTTQDAFALTVVKELDRSLGALLRPDVELHIVMWMPTENGGALRSQLRGWMKQVAPTATLGFNAQRTIEGARVELSVAPRRVVGNRITAIIANANSSADIGLNACELLADRIGTKRQVCAGVSGPVWLALYNDYWLADAQTYQQALNALAMTHCFERIFVVSHQRAVTELHIRNESPPAIRTRSS